MSEPICSTCKRPFTSTLPRRVCANCQRQIAKHHKWRWRDDGRAEHRNYQEPDSYLNTPAE